MNHSHSATVIAGIPAENLTLYHRIGFSVGDPAAYVLLPDGQRFLLIRDIEISRANKHARVDRVYCPADFAPTDGLAGDRQIATAQALAQLLKTHQIKNVIADRSLALIYLEQIQNAGIAVQCDPDLGLIDRRIKNEKEIQYLKNAQKITEQAMQIACTTIANAQANAQGILHHQGATLTSQSVKAIIDRWLLDQGYTTPGNIVACGKDGGDCHHSGSGPLYTQQPIIIDIFPKSQETRYHGDCTRTVIHGPIDPQLQKMHQTVCQAKAAATDRLKAGATGNDIHRATAHVIQSAGYAMGLPKQAGQITMPHGTGHGVGLAVHEAPLLDHAADHASDQLLAGDVVTIEPGLYGANCGGIRVEDMLLVTADGYENFNRLHQGLNWK